MSCYSLFPVRLYGSCLQFSSTLKILFYVSWKYPSIDISLSSYLKHFSICFLLLCLSKACLNSKGVASARISLVVALCSLSSHVLWSQVMGFHFLLIPFPFPNSYSYTLFNIYIWLFPLLTFTSHTQVSSSSFTAHMDDQLLSSSNKIQLESCEVSAYLQGWSSD